MSTTTVILGGGIIGLSTAYYLSLQSPSEKIHLVESSPVLFSSASGKAAGFLAKDWFVPASSELGGLSFNLHRRLAEEFGGREKWGYSPSVSYSLDQSATPSPGSERGEDWLFNGTSRAQVAKDDGSNVASKPKGPTWITHKGAIRKISDLESTAQVDPYRLCQFLLEQSQAQGLQLHQPAKATKIIAADDVTITGIKIVSDDSIELDIPCDSLLIACGAWTTLVYDTLFPKATRTPKIISLAGHSVVMKSDKWATPADEEGGCHAVFTTHPLGFSPEIFSRIGGEIWLGGLNSSTIPVPELATGVEIDEKSIKDLVQVGKELCGDDVEVMREGLCHRPVTRTGIPLVARVEEKWLGGVKGKVYVASGHGPWGISMSLGTGWVVSEMIQGKKPSADIKGLGRF
ncbi:hypothetical protein JAAARDRAFT_138757 [Jaapia argillacea MUCL 33604]|uniref:FAD dependent oxidoreductase domain-containing protein n=1 Tax=Jaapia argillacea MUCL 33604 TaxID=933084 RepID=A0A067PPV9_9AGAM|nr:hypothetical protein JAAARDRAFT_138757 [Jaapia argillacea MUCL 33604]